MTTTHASVPTFRPLIILACFALCPLDTTHAQTPDINKIWTAVGSTGTVDEADTSKVFFDSGKVQMGTVIAGNQLTPAISPSIIPQTQSAVIRYNVVPVEGLFAVKPPCFTQTGTECPGIQLKLRYLVTGSGARVIANLLEVDLDTGAEVTKLSFDSQSFPIANNYQVQSVGQCGPQIPRQPFDFARKAYYIEARLTTHAILAGSAAGVQIIKVANIGCVG